MARALDIWAKRLSTLSDETSRVFRERRVDRVGRATIESVRVDRRFSVAQKALAAAIPIVLAAGVISAFVVPARQAQRVPHAPVSADQVAALQSFEAARQRSAEGNGIPQHCAVDLLGAQVRGDATHVWATATCVGIVRCQVVTDGTTGIVADLVGTVIKNPRYDETIDGNDLTDDHALYPRGLWSKEHGLTDGDGTLALHVQVARQAGCPATMFSPHA